MPQKAKREDQAAKQSVADIETWDPTVNVEGRKLKGSWVKNGDASDKAHFSDLTSDGAKKENRRKKDLNGGKLSLEELAGLDRATVSRINPKSAVPRKILKGALKSSWKFAKKALVSNSWPGVDTKPEDKKLGETVMRKIWEFRQWDHWELLEDVSRQLAQDDESADNPGLDMSKTSASGSTTVTSDIDVNLKGSRTEEAATLFNRQFKTTRGSWPHESGVVYDVNVYALDVIHGVVMPDEGSLDAKIRSKKEGSRVGKKGGGFTAGSKAKKKDSINQDIQSMLHMRIYMTDGQWATYRTRSLESGLKKKALDQVEARFEQYQQEILDEMLRAAQDVDEETKTAAILASTDSSKNGEAQMEALGTGLSGGDHIKGENAMMAASNRIYEKKTKEVGELRKSLAKAIAAFNKEPTNKALEKRAEEILVLVRQKISEMLVYANEVYVTDAAVNHAVLGTQGNVAHTQALEESRRVVQENTGDVLKEVSHYSGNWEKAGFKAGKYLWRLADGARNMDSGDFSAFLAPHKQNILKTYSAGEVIANHIKIGMAAEGEGAQVAAAGVVLKKAGIKSAADLQNRAMGISLGVNAAYQKYVKANLDTGANSLAIQGQPEQFRN